MIRRPLLRLLTIAISFCLVVWLAYRLGPRHEIIEPDVAQAIPHDALALETQIAEIERRIDLSPLGPITPGAEKRIFWAHSDRRKTAYSVIYLHGYSATRQEVTPLTEKLAAHLGANLFHTRLSGHGQPGAAMASATASDWLNDTLEAYAIGEQIGERVIVVGTSTGGTLALWLARRAESARLAALLLISPNLGPRDPRSEWLKEPWGAQLAAAVIGPTYEWRPANETHAKFWTWRYPSSALIPMMALVDYVRASDLERITTPTLVIYSNQDRVVSHEQIEAMFDRLGSRASRAPSKQRVLIERSQDPSNHVLAGDALAPQDTANILRHMQNFLSSVHPL
ncbi:MAG: alpha/beta hydrolase [Steroidobacteraceae bacterium]